MAIACDPKALLKAARCLPCLTPRQQRLAQASLFCRVAVVGIKGGGGGPSIIFPTPNLTVVSNLSGTVLTATWDIPPGGATGTEIWIAPDGVNYVLDTTVAAAFNTHFYGAIAVGSFQWYKVRYTNGAGGFSNFSTPVQWSGQAMDWAARVLAHAGTLQSTAILTATNVMWCTLFNAGLSSHILALNPIAHNGNQGVGGLSAALTPLIKGAGSDPWGNHNGNDTTITANGFACAGAIGALPGWVPTTYASNTNAGLHVYDINGGADGGNYVSGGYDGADGLTGLRVDNAGTLQSYMFSLANGLGVAAPAAGGFFSANRVAANDHRDFWGNSGNAFAQVGATNAAAAGPLSTINLGFGGLCQNNVGNISLFTGHTLSFWCVSDGFSLANATILFNAVQAMRVSYGGGFV